MTAYVRWSLILGGIAAGIVGVELCKWSGEHNQVAASTRQLSEDIQAGVINCGPVKPVCEVSPVVRVDTTPYERLTIGNLNAMALREGLEGTWFALGAIGTIIGGAASFSHGVQKLTERA